MKNKLFFLFFMLFSLQASLYGMDDASQLPGVVVEQQSVVAQKYEHTGQGQGAAGDGQEPLDHKAEVQTASALSDVASRRPSVAGKNFDDEDLAELRRIATVRINPGNMASIKTVLALLNQSGAGGETVKKFNALTAPKSVPSITSIFGDILSSLPSQSESDSDSLPKDHKQVVLQSSNEDDSISGSLPDQLEERKGVELQSDDAPKKHHRHDHTDTIGGIREHQLSQDLPKPESLEQLCAMLYLNLNVNVYKEKAKQFLRALFPSHRLDSLLAVTAAMENDVAGILLRDKSIINIWFFYNHRCIFLYKQLFGKVPQENTEISNEIRKIVAQEIFEVLKSVEWAFRSITFLLDDEKMPMIYALPDTETIKSLQAMLIQQCLINKEEGIKIKKTDLEEVWSSKEEYKMLNKILELNVEDKDQDLIVSFNRKKHIYEYNSTILQEIRNLLGAARLEAVDKIVAELHKQVELQKREDEKRAQEAAKQRAATNAQSILQRKEKEQKARNAQKEKLAAEVAAKAEVAARMKAEKEKKEAAEREKQKAEHAQVASTPTCSCSTWSCWPWNWSCCSSCKC